MFITPESVEQMKTVGHAQVRQVQDLLRSREKPVVTQASLEPLRKGITEAARILVQATAEETVRQLRWGRSKQAAQREEMPFPILSPSAAARRLPWDDKVAMAWLREQGLVRQRQGGGAYVSWREVVDRLEGEDAPHVASAVAGKRGRRRSAPWVDPES